MANKLEEFDLRSSNFDNHCLMKVNETFIELITRQLLKRRLGEKLRFEHVFSFPETLTFTSQTGNFDEKLIQLMPRVTSNLNSYYSSANSNKPSVSAKTIS